MSPAASVMEANTHSTKAATADDYSRVKMKIKAINDKIAVTLQKASKACSLREGRLPLALSTT